MPQRGSVWWRFGNKDRCCKLGDIICDNRINICIQLKYIYKHPDTFKYMQKVWQLLMFSDPTSLSGSKYCPISYPWPHSGKCCIHPVDSGSCEKHEVYYEKELISAEKSISCPECTKPPSNQYITLIVIAYITLILLMRGQKSSV